jgi:dihydropteroate synthase
MSNTDQPADAERSRDEAHSFPSRDFKWAIAGGVLSISVRPLVMGIVNVTPDSFSDGGRYLAFDAAVAHGLELAGQGADILDIGGESTRPGSATVPETEEIGRVIPVIEALARRTSLPLSVDTSKSNVARASLQAGARIVNDVTGLTGDPDMVATVRDFGAGVIVMHMQGTPATMQVNPHYTDVVDEIASFLDAQLRAACAAGVKNEQIALDPGIGFGKTSAHNRQIMTRLQEFQRFGRPICLGVSRKGFINHLVGADRPVDRRLAGWLGLLCFALARRSVQIVRVHDVEETRDAIAAFERLNEGGDLRSGVSAGSETRAERG